MSTSRDADIELVGDPIRVALLDADRLRVATLDAEDSATRMTESATRTDRIHVVDRLDGRKRALVDLALTALGYPPDNGG